MRCKDGPPMYNRTNCEILYSKYFSQPGPIYISSQAYQFIIVRNILQLHRIAPQLPIVHLSWKQSLEIKNGLWNYTRIPYKTL